MDTNQPAQTANAGQPAEQHFEDAFAEFSAAQGGSAPLTTEPASKGGDGDPDAGNPKTATPPDTAMPAAESGDADRLKAERDAALQAARSDAGRQAALQRRLAEERERRAAAERALQQKLEPASSQDDATMAQLEADMPELAAVLKAERERHRADLAAVSAAARLPAESLTRENHLTQQFAALGAAHPDWMQVVNDPAFHGWVNQQPLRVRDILNSDDADESVWLLSQFKREQTQVQTQAKAATDKVAAERDRRLQSAVGVPARGGRPESSGAPEDFESAFEFYARKR